MKNIPALIYRDHEAMSVAAAQLFITECNKCILEKGFFTVALSGGSTPQRLHELLATHPFSRNIPWQHVFIFFSDERHVPHYSAESNFKMAHDHLFNHIPVAAGNVFAVSTGDGVKKDAETYENELLSFFKNKKPHFDLIVLGVGTDGHTASLFPGTDTLKEKKRWVVAGIHPATKQERITFTFRLLNAARRVIILASGQEKAAIVAAAILQKENKKKLPVSGVHPRKGNLLWMIDEAAATALNKPE